MPKYVTTPVTTPIARRTRAVPETRAITAAVVTAIATVVRNTGASEATAAAIPSSILRAATANATGPVMSTLTMRYAVATPVVPQCTPIRNAATVEDALSKPIQTAILVRPLAT